jgi:serine/threonine protein kinase HipA of HipAB toxin-antitoxin module
VALADQRRIATQMAVLAQVHVARLQYLSAYQQFQRADAIYGVDERINGIIGAGERAQTQSKLDRVSSNTTTILSLLRRYQALALAHAAASKLQATMGAEPEVPSVHGSSLGDLQRVASEFTRQTQGGLQ